MMEPTICAANSPDWKEHIEYFNPDVPYDLDIHLATIANTGRIRTTNEDCCGHIDAGDFHIFVIADGLGGHPHGEKASHEVTRLFLEARWENWPADMGFEDVETFLQNLFHQAQKKLKSYRDRRDTTLVVAVLHKNKILIMNVGDSRAVFDQRGNKVQTTRQGVGWYVANSVESGNVTSDDCWVEIEFNPNIPFRLVLMTDGCDEADLDMIYNVSATAEEICKDAIKHGSTDNCTAITINGTMRNLQQTEASASEES